MGLQTFLIDGGSVNGTSILWEIVRIETEKAKGQARQI